MLTNYTVIAYKDVVENNSKEDIIRRLYDDDTEKSFSSQDDAIDYRKYLDQKLPFNGNTATDLYISEVYNSGELDIEPLYRADALAKLTELEKEALGII